MPRKNIPDAENRILKAALTVIAEKSYDGARVDNIAREANVPKSLIYYHFKSKNEIYERLIGDFLREFLAVARESSTETDGEKAQHISKRLQQKYYELALRNADLIRILLIDSLKKSTKQPDIYKIVEAIANTDAEISQSIGKERSERLIAEFFTSILPNCAVLCYMDSFTSYFNIDRAEFGMLYPCIMGITHGAYHKSKEQNSPD